MSLITFKNTCSTKDTTKRLKWQSTNWEWALKLMYKICKSRVSYDKKDPHKREGKGQGWDNSKMEVFGKAGKDQNTQGDTCFW